MWGPSVDSWATDIVFWVSRRKTPSRRSRRLFWESVWDGVGCPGRQAGTVPFPVSKSVTPVSARSPPSARTHPQAERPTGNPVARDAIIYRPPPCLAHLARRHPPPTPVAAAAAAAPAQPPRKGLDTRVPPRWNRVGRRPQLPTFPRGLGKAQRPYRPISRDVAPPAILFPGREHKTRALPSSPGSGQNKQRRVRH